MRQDHLRRDFPLGCPAVGLAVGYVGEFSDMNAYALIDMLIERYSLNECEAGDLGAYADVLEHCHGLTGATLEAQIRLRAEVLSICGSEMQEMYDTLERTYKRQHEREEYA
ncbi:hypothetical protein LCGC14_2667820 [marine sediment metagenome]|uniref:Uncharacterized protein n=1 Tax=marine sediment metagenome TaxID=412755 RepID=A0A0F8ZPY9_9ZZZZ